jgi:glyoxylase-like metal-dependent hydrolase (beta-lactamase superfamily II)
MRYISQMYNFVHTAQVLTARGSPNINAIEVFAMTSVKKFASHADTEEKKVTFEQLSEHAYAYTAEGDPNTGIIIGDDAVLVADTQATPVMAQDVIRRIREVTDKPIKYVLLTHYHAVRVLGASAYNAEQIIASQDTYDLIVERGEQDMKSEIERFPRLFNAVESVPGLTWPTLTFQKKMTLWMGKLEVQILQLGRGHTKGDTVVWLPEEKTLLSGDLVEYGATPYAGDAREAGSGSRCGPQDPARSGRRSGRNARFCQRALREGEVGRERRQGPQRDLQRHFRHAQAQVRRLGHLRPLHAV